MINRATMDAVQMGVAIASAQIDNPSDSSLAGVIVKQYLDDGVNPQHLICGLSNVINIILTLIKLQGGPEPTTVLQVVSRMASEV